MGQPICEQFMIFSSCATRKLDQLGVDPNGQAVMLPIGLETNKLWKVFPWVQSSTGCWLPGCAIINVATGMALRSRPVEGPVDMVAARPKRAVRFGGVRLK